MKRLIFNTLLFTLFLSACQRESLPDLTPPDHTGRVPLVLRAEGFDLADGFETKSVAVTNAGNLYSFYASATTGAAGAEVSSWPSTEFTKESDVYVGGKYWPLSDPGYHIYASNRPLTFDANGTFIQASNDQDVVCAYQSSVAYKSANVLIFKHIFARIGTLTVTAKEGYQISDVSIKLTPKTGGTYNLRTGEGHFEGTGWSNPTSGTAVELTNGTTGSKNSDLYLVPGIYILTATWTATRGEYVETFTSKTTTVNLVGNKITNLNTTLGGRAVAIQFNVTVTDWGNAAIVPEFPMS